MRIHCDACGEEIEKDAAIVVELDDVDEVLYFCSPECAEEAERRETVRGPGRDEDPSAPDPA